MKKLHILNIGYPKCGTTWLWENLSNQVYFTSPTEKENNKLLFGQTIKKYQEVYSKYDITGNFSPAMFTVDRYLIKGLADIPTVTSTILFRNPIEVGWSLYNFLSIFYHKKISFEQYCYDLFEQHWFFSYSKIVTRWREHFGTDRFFIFYYDDLIHGQTFFNNYSKTIGLPFTNHQTLPPVNITKYYNKTLPDIGKHLIDKFNQTVYNLQDTVDKDLTHWLL